MTHYDGADRKDDLHIGSVAANMTEESRTANGVVFLRVEICKEG